MYAMVYFFPGHSVLVVLVVVIIMIIIIIITTKCDITSML